MFKTISFSLFALFVSGFASGVTPVGYAPASTSTLHWIFDRTATDSRWDIAQGAQHEPLVSATADKWHFGIQGLSAGGEIKLVVASYQLWLLLHPDISDRKEIPQNTSQLRGTFRLTFFGKSGAIASQEVMSYRFLAKVEPPACENIECLNRNNPGYFPLLTTAVTIPMETLRVELMPLSVTDLATGETRSVSTQSKSVAITYHIDANPVHLVGMESTTPLASDARQFSIVEPFPIPASRSIEINLGDIKNGRPFAMMYFNSSLSKKIGQIPVCYDKFNPSRVHYAEGNDVQIVSEVMQVRVDGGGWQKVNPTKTGIFRFTPGVGRTLEFNFGYGLSVDLRAGLRDPNRCYQLGSDFKWTPSQPGVDTVSLDSTFDAPNGDGSRGWELPLQF